MGLVAKFIEKDTRAIVNVPNASLVLLKGDLLNTRADAIVCPVGRSLLPRSALGSDIFTKYPKLGEEIPAFKKQMRTKTFELGSALVFDSGVKERTCVPKLVSLAVLDARKDFLDSYTYTNHVETAVLTSFGGCSNYEIKSIAFPILDTFRDASETDSIVNIMAKKIIGRMNDTWNRIKTFKLVVSPDKYEMALVEVYKAAFDVLILPKK